ncbi:PREDICTED: uncharacterized protein LOC106812182 [Priapulus caudatus]|uniref:Uncharacterized protein LOC106812182 n=1 Tax=Priapulus caudatus TaxID=37621 RepID=A0ABM1EH23_PRICU|nr:PREDICTED: uncharacterized protein LOC106812182 [Priapulus caudatus]
MALLSSAARLAGRNLRNVARMSLVATSQIVGGGTVRPTTEADLPAVGKLWQDQFGFENGMETMKIMIDYCKGGTFVGLNEQGDHVGFITASRTDTQSMGGHFIVQSDYRGTGVGDELFRRRGEFIGDRNFGVNSVMYRVNANRRLGFTVSSFTVNLMEHHVDHAKMATRPPLPSCSATIQPYTDDMYDDVSAYDAQIAGHPRDGFLKPYLAAHVNRSYVAIEGQSKIVGYTTITPMTGLFSFGLFPLYGDDAAIQSKLLRTIVADLPDGAAVVAGGAATNNRAFEMYTAHGWIVEMQALRIYTKHDRDFPLKKVGSVLHLDVCGI